MKKNNGLRVSSLRRVKSAPGHGLTQRQEGSLLIDVDHVSPHKGQIQLDGLQVKDLEIDVATSNSGLGLGNNVGLISEFTALNETTSAKNSRFSSNRTYEI